MSDTDRVRAWRDRLKQAGLVPMTIWVKAETKARYEDLALSYHRSPSELAHQALDAYRPDRPSVSASVTDTEQIRSFIQAEVAQLTAQITATVTATVTDTVTATATATVTEALMAQLPGLVQAAVPHCVADTVTDAVTDTSAGVAASAPRTAPVTATETDTPPLRPRRRPPEPMAAAPAAARASEARPQRRGGRPPSPERQQILTLLAAHPEGLSAEELRVYVKPAKPLGDTLQGMRKTGVLRVRHDGKTLRYVLA